MKADGAAGSTEGGKDDSISLLIVAGQW